MAFFGTMAVDASNNKQAPQQRNRYQKQIKKQNSRLLFRLYIKGILYVLIHTQNSTHHRKSPGHQPGPSTQELKLSLLSESYNLLLRTGIFSFSSFSFLVRSKLIISGSLKSFFLLRTLQSSLSSSLVGDQPIIIWFYSSSKLERYIFHVLSIYLMSLSNTSIGQIYARQLQAHYTKTYPQTRLCKFLITYVLELPLTTEKNQ